METVESKVTKFLQSEEDIGEIDTRLSCNNADNCDFCEDGKCLDPDQPEDCESRIVPPEVEEPFDAPPEPDEPDEA